MSEKIEKPNKAPLKERIRDKVPKKATVLGVGAAALVMVGFVETVDHLAKYDSDEPARVLEHKYVPEDEVGAGGYGKFGISSSQDEKFELVVSQHEPGKVESDDAGNVKFDVEVSESDYSAIEDGTTVEDLDVKDWHVNPDSKPDNIVEFIDQAL